MRIETQLWQTLTSHIVRIERMYGELLSRDRNYTYDINDCSNLNASFKELIDRRLAT